jgi:hypothetical protein
MNRLSAISSAVATCAVTLGMMPGCSTGATETGLREGYTVLRNGHTYTVPAGGAVIGGVWMCAEADKTCVHRSK